MPDIDPAIAQAVEDAKKAASAATASAAAAALSAQSAKTDAAIANEGTRDKPPHPITLTINIVSAAVGAAAMVMAIFALLTNQKSLHVGQRAYLTVQNGTLQVAPTNPLLISLAGVKPTQPEYRKLKPGDPSYL